IVFLHPVVRQNSTASTILRPGERSQDIKISSRSWMAKAQRGIGRRLDPRTSFCRLSMDNPMEEEYLLCYIQREKHKDAKIGSSPGSACPDSAQSSRRFGAAARVWHRPPERAGERAGASIE